MNWQKHLIAGILIFLVSIYFLKISLFSFETLYLLLIVFVFSLLPDIDSSKSNISFLFRFIYVFVGIYSAYQIFIQENIFYWVSLVLAIILLLFHSKISSGDFRHRKFPHSFTFGILAFGVVYIFTSLSFAIIGFVCFFVHLILDNHVFKAIKYDSRLWKRIFKR